MIPVQCTACGNQYELPDEDAGTQAQCACGQVLEIPTGEAGSVNAQAAATIPIQCPSCASQYELSAEDAGTQVQCGCGQVIDVPVAADTPPGIALECTGCEAAYEVGLENAGTQMQCACGEVLTVPANDAACDSVGTTIPVSCSSCGSQYEVSASDAGQQVQCPCGEVMVVPEAAPVEAGEPAGAQGSAVAETEAAESEPASTSDDDPSSDNPPSDNPPSSKKQKKEASQFFWPGVVAGILLLSGVGYLLWPDGTDQQSAGTETDETEGEAAGAESRGRPPGAANEWPAWVSDDSFGLIIVRPKQMLESPLGKKVPHQELIETVLAETGVDLASVEEAVIVLDPPAGAGEASPPESEPLTTAFLRFSGKANRRSLSSTLLPDGEAVTVKGRTFFRGSAGSLFFPDSSTIVFGGSEHLESRLAEIVAGKPVSNPLLNKAAGPKPASANPAGPMPANLKPLPGDLIVLIRKAGLADAPLPPDAQEKLAGVEEAVVTLDLSGGVLLKVQIEAADEASAKKLEATATELMSLAVTQFASFKPLLEAELPNASPVKAVEDLLNRTRVFRNGSSVTVSTPPPLNLAEAVVQSVPLLAPLGQNLLASGAVEATASSTPGQPTTGVNSGTSPDAGGSSGGIKTRPRLPVPSQEKFRIFGQAYERFGEMYGEAEDLKKKIKDAEDKPAARKAWLNKLAEAAGMMQQVERLAVRLADLQPDNSEKLLQSRYVLAFLYSQLKMHYEAGILGTYVAKHDDPTKDRARDSGFIALAAWQSAYSDAPPDDRLAELEAFVESASLLDEKWPDNENLDRVRYVVGQIQQINLRHEPAAEWFLKVRPEFADYAKAQVYAGQAYWRAYRELERKHRDLLREARATIDINSEFVPAPATDRIDIAVPKTPAEEPQKKENPNGENEPAVKKDLQTQEGESEASVNPPNEEAGTPPESQAPEAPAIPPIVEDELIPADGATVSAVEIEAKLGDLLEKAKQHLKTGIAEFQKKELEAPPEALIAGKMSLAEALLRSDDAAAALAILRDEPFPLLAEIQIEEGAERPEEGTKSREFASAVHQLHLRACVSAKDLEAGRGAMLALESLASEKDASRLTAIYLQIGKDLTAEIQAAEPKRAVELRSSFSDFLTTMAEREQQTYGSLLWVAETSTEFGESSAESAEAKQFHARAADAYQAILDNAAANRDFCSANTVAAIRIRLATSCQRAGRFEQALKLLNSLLTLQPNSFKMQTTAALALQEWGATTDENERLLESIQGYGDSIWGWGKLSVTLQRHINGGTGKPEYADLMRQARYQIALARRDYALAQTGEDKTGQLQKAITEIRTFAQLDESLAGKWWQKIDEVYQMIQKDLGETPKSIQSEFQKKPAAPETTSPSKDAS